MYKWEKRATWPSQGHNILYMRLNALLHVLLSITSVCLCDICSQAEDKVDELTQELLKTRHHLEVTEEEKREKEEEATQVQWVFCFLSHTATVFISLCGLCIWQQLVIISTVKGTLQKRAKRSRGRDQQGTQHHSWLQAGMDTAPSAL